MSMGFLSWIFPAHCHGCGRKDTDFCDECLRKTPKANPVPDAWVLPLFSYQHPPLRTVILALKFKGRFPLADIFGPALADAAYSLFEDRFIFSGTGQEILVVPIPTSKKSRGYNQAALLSRALVAHANFPAVLAEGVLKKVRTTPRQAEIKQRTKRLENIAGAFLAQSEGVRGKIVLLVDDVTTTGATLKEARRALRVAGAKGVYAVTVAH